jgi:ABC-type multidrug transport system permease subunit
MVRNAETATVAGFIITFPLVFAASTFTSTSAMPEPLRSFAEAQPVTKVADAVRALTHGSGFAGHATADALMWCAGILLVAAALATWKFRRV